VEIIAKKNSQSHIQYQPFVEREEVGEVIISTEGDREDDSVPDIISTFDGDFVPKSLKD